MTPFQRLSKRILERLAGTFYEGPTPPARLGEMVVAYANQHPHATRAEWAEFAMEHAAESYRSGYVRGHEEAERDYKGPEVDPGATADALDPDWRWQPAVELRDPAGEVLEANDEEALADAEARAYYDAVAARNERSGS